MSKHGWRRISCSSSSAVHITARPSRRLCRLFTPTKLLRSRKPWTWERRLCHYRGRASVSGGESTSIHGLKSFCHERRHGSNFTFSGSMLVSMRIPSLAEVGPSFSTRDLCHWLHLFSQGPAPDSSPLLTSSPFCRFSCFSSS